MTEETVTGHSIAVECYTQSDPVMGGEKPRNIRKKGIMIKTQRW